MQKGVLRMVLGVSQSINKIPPSGINSNPSQGMFGGVLVTFARREESRAFRLKLSQKQSVSWKGRMVTTGLLNEINVSVVHTGIGPVAARLLTSDVLQSHKPMLWVGAGFAGALDPDLQIGDVLLEEPNYPKQTGRVARLISRDEPVESSRTKQALFKETGASAVDMETQFLAEELKESAIPFLAVRVISDTATQDLPVPFGVWFDLKKQAARPFALLAYLCVHPARSPGFFRFLCNLPKVGGALALGVEAALMGNSVNFTLEPSPPKDAGTSAQK